jgi:hypothetical protein
MLAHMEASQRLATSKVPSGLVDEMNELRQKGVQPYM